MYTRCSLISKHTQPPLSLLPLCVFVFRPGGVILRYGLLWYATSFPYNSLSPHRFTTNHHIDPDRVIIVVKALVYLGNLPLRVCFSCKVQLPSVEPTFVQHNLSRGVEVEGEILIHFFLSPSFFFPFLYVESKFVQHNLKIEWKRNTYHRKYFGHNNMGSLEKLCCCFDSIAVAFVILCHMLTLSAGLLFTCCWPGWLDKCPLWVTSPTTSTLLTHKPLEDHTTNKLRHTTNKANHQQTQPTTSRADKHKSANSRFCLRI